MIRIKTTLLFAAIATSLFPSCNSGSGEKVSEVTGEIMIDGSSTVYPITEIVAEEFRTEFPKVNVTIGLSGTGGGFKKFVKGETDINNASRSIKGEEKDLASSAGISFLEIP